MQDKPASRIGELLPGNVAGQLQAQHTWRHMGCLQGREITPGCRPVSLTLTRQRHGEQTVIFFFDDRVTLTAAFFQPCAIEHRDVPACVTDQSGLL